MDNADRVLKHVATATAVPMVRSSALMPFLGFAERIGVPAERRLAEAKLPASICADPEALIPMKQAFLLVDHLARKEGLAHVGFLVGSQTQFQDLGAFGRLVLQSLTLHDALEKISRVITLYSSAQRIWIDRFGHRARLEAGAEVRRLSEGKQKDLAKARKRVEETDIAIQRIVRSIASGLISDEDARAQIEELKVERERQRGILGSNATRNPIIEIQPQAIEHYQQILDRLCGVAVEAARSDSATQLAIREFIQTVKVFTEPATSIQVTGRLAALTGENTPGKQVKTGVSVVAGVRDTRTAPLPVFEFLHWQLAA